MIKWLLLGFYFWRILVPFGAPVFGPASSFGGSVLHAAADEDETKENGGEGGSGI